MDNNKLGYKVAIFDPTSILGKEMKKVLIERKFPFQSVKLLDCKEKMGTLAAFDDEATFIQLANSETLEDSDVVFFCGNGVETKKLATMHSELDFFAFDLSRSMSESDGYKYFISGVNHKDTEGYTGIYASPHSVSVLLVKFLSRLHKTFNIEFAAATVMTSVSEDGLEGISNLHQQTTNILSFTSLNGRQRIFNLYPDLNAYPEEAAEISGEVESLSQLKNGSFTLSLVDVPTFFGTAATVYAEFKNAPASSFSWKKLFSSKEGFKYDGDISKGDSPVGLVEIAETDLLHIQHLSTDQKNSKKNWFWILADNVRLCSVINIIEVAEGVLKLGR